MDNFDDLYYVSRLISGYLKDDLSDNEKLELENWLDANPANRAQFERMIAENKLQSDFSAFGGADKASAWKRIVKETGYRKSKKSFSYYRVAAAASIILGLTIGAYSLLHKKPAPQIAQNQTHEILPGGNKAILTLANGNQISLTDAKNGKLAVQGNTAISKTSAGQVVYQAAPSGTGNPQSEIAYNTVSTPRGGQYHLTLADGTNVWLNAASSIKYPIAFTGNDRQVEITGEAYFEVVHNAAQPFKVAVNGQTVEDIGTHFNINAYSDEPAIKTTLLEGAVKVSTAKQNGVTLVPGQQAQVIAGKFPSKINVVVVDADETVAWKNGLTSFDNADIYELMRQVGRWYDVKVLYEGDIPQKHFTGAVSRSAKLSDLLKILELSDIHFKVEGKTITVMP